MIISIFKGGSRNSGRLSNFPSRRQEVIKLGVDKAKSYTFALSRISNSEKEFYFKIVKERPIKNLICDSGHSSVTPEAAKGSWEGHCRATVGEAFP